MAENLVSYCQAYLTVSLEAFLLCWSRDAYCNILSLLDMLVSMIQLIYENIHIYLFIYISILYFCMNVASWQREHMVFIHLGLAYSTEYNGLQLGMVEFHSF